MVQIRLTKVDVNTNGSITWHFNNGAETHNSGAKDLPSEARSQYLEAMEGYSSYSMLENKLQVIYINQPKPCSINIHDRGPELDPETGENVIDGVVGPTIKGINVDCENQSPYNSLTIGIVESSRTGNSYSIHAEDQNGVAFSIHQPAMVNSLVKFILEKNPPVNRY